MTLQLLSHPGRCSSLQCSVIQTAPDIPASVQSSYRPSRSAPPCLHGARGVQTAQAGHAPGHTGRRNAPVPATLPAPLPYSFAGICTGGRVHPGMAGICHVGRAPETSSPQQELLPTGSVWVSRAGSSGGSPDPLVERLQE